MAGRRLVGGKHMNDLNGNLAERLQAIENDGFTIIENAIDRALVAVSYTHLTLPTSDLV